MQQQLDAFPQFETSVFESDPSQLWPRKEKSPEKALHQHLKLDNEYEQPPQVSFDVLKPVVFEEKDHKGDIQTLDLTDNLKMDFDYYAVTQQPEINTERTQFLQNYVDIWCQGNPDWEGKTRVVILNRGLHPSAFAYPDGTILISQSLITSAGSLDIAVSALAHEVDHLLNGTSLFAYREQVKRGSSLGIDWLHEIFSDAGTASLLEKVGLKSTAISELMGKLAESGKNTRGREHQAPILRAIEHLGLHGAIDYETSHLDYTPLPELLKSPVLPTHLETIIDATVKDDPTSVKEYLPKLHKKDFATFFSIVDSRAYYKFSTLEPSKETITSIVGFLSDQVTTRLKEIGLTDDQVKLFFLSFTGAYSSFSPRFKNLTEIKQLISQANELYAADMTSKIAVEMFGDGRYFDSLHDLLDVVSIDLEKLTDSDDLNYIDIDTICSLIGTVYDLVKINLESDPKRTTQIIETLQHILFKYIEKFYLVNVKDAELDPEQMLDLFQSLKEAGYEQTEGFYYFPIRNEKCKPRNQKIISQAFSQVFGIDLVRTITSDRKIEALPTLETFQAELSSFHIDSISTNIVRFASEHNLDHQTRAQYVDIALDFVLEADFATTELHKLIQEKIGIGTFHNWKKYGDPSWSTPNDRLQAIFAKATGQATPKPRSLSLEELMAEFNLDQASLLEEAQHQAEYKRTRTAIRLLADTLKYSEDLLLDRIEMVMSRTKIDLNQLDVYQILTTCAPLFALANNDDSSSILQTATIRDFERFYALPFIGKIREKISVVHCDDLQSLYTQLNEAKNRYGSYPLSINFRLFDDDTYSVMLGEVFRSEFLRLTEPSNLKSQDYLVLISLLHDFVPYSPQREQLLKVLQKEYLLDPNVPVQAKIDFFIKEHRSLGIDGAILVADAISDVSTYRVFRAQLDKLEIDYVTGEKSVTDIALMDIASTGMTKKADVVIKSTSDSREISQEISTELAINWLKIYLNPNALRLNPISYDPDQKKFVMGEHNRTTFLTVKDSIDQLQQLPDSKKTIIALKALADQDGLLVTEDGKKLLETMVLDGLDVNNDFFRSVLSNAIQKGDIKIVGLPLAQMLTPFLFRGLGVDNIDHGKVRNLRIKSKSGESKSEKVKSQPYADELPYLFGATARELRFFGPKFSVQPHSEIAQQAQKSNETYFSILQQLSTTFLDKDESDSEDSPRVKLPASTEAIIKAAETSPLFVRDMQMASQLFHFNAAISNRLAQTQDSMQGMDKLRFWENLLSKSDRDPELAHFIEEDLISLDDYLGGGSLFTTFGATIKGPDGVPQKVVIKMLNPNAEEFVRLSYDFSSTVLDEVEQHAKGKTKKHAKAARSLLDLSYVWCIRDINDDTYEQLDDAFRRSVDAFNQSKGQTAIRAPERIRSTKKVKIEAQFEGTTLNKYLATPGVEQTKKTEVVQSVMDFFDYQFEFSPFTSADGKKMFVFHSDPHAGNIMLDPSQENIVPGIIDRSMYLVLEDADVEIFKLLKSGNRSQFIRKFIDRCLEINGIIGTEARKIKYSLIDQLGGELVRQTLSGKADATAFLQVVTQEFALFGERYTAIENQPGNTETEKTIIDYVTKHPDVNVLDMYEALHETLVNPDEPEKKLSYKEFKTLLRTMKMNGLVQRKAIDVPLEYRLMIRNIYAMKNLKEKWLTE